MNLLLLLYIFLLEEKQKMDLGYKLVSDTMVLLNPVVNVLNVYTIHTQ